MYDTFMNDLYGSLDKKPKKKKKMIKIIKKMMKFKNSKGSKVYIPTEAGLPILEARR